MLSLPHVQPAAPKEHFDWAEKPQRNVFRFSKSYLQGASSARNKDASKQTQGRQREREKEEENNKNRLFLFSALRISFRTKICNSLDVRLAKEIKNYIVLEDFLD